MDFNMDINMTDLDFSFSDLGDGIEVGKLDEFFSTNFTTVSPTPVSSGLITPDTEEDEVVFIKSRTIIDLTLEDEDVPGQVEQPEPVQAQQNPELVPSPAKKVKKTYDWLKETDPEKVARSSALELRRAAEQSVLDQKHEAFMARKREAEEEAARLKKQRTERAKESRRKKRAELKAQKKQEEKEEKEVEKEMVEKEMVEEEEEEETSEAGSDEEGWEGPLRSALAAEAVSTVQMYSEEEAAEMERMFEELEEAEKGSGEVEGAAEEWGELEIVAEESEESEEE